MLCPSCGHKLRAKREFMVCGKCKQNPIQRTGIKAIAKMRVINKPQDYK